MTGTYWWYCRSASRGGIQNKALVALGLRVGLMKEKEGQLQCVDLGIGGRRNGKGQRERTARKARDCVALSTQAVLYAVTVVSAVHLA
jgi:hypothetical protein